jgi:transcriptional regulator with XRE-family HTH domain
MPFPEKLARLIDLRGVSQSRLARETGIAQPKISAMASGKQRPYMDQAIKLAQGLGVSLDWLADDAQDELPAPDPEREFVAKLVDAIGVGEAKRRLLAPQATLNADPPMVPLPPKPPGSPPLELGPGHATGGRRRKSS